MSRSPLQVPMVAEVSPLARRFEAIVFDWDGTAVPDRQADAAAVRSALERLCALGLDATVVTGTHVGNVEGQLGARPVGPGRLLFCVNRGSEIYEADDLGVHLVARREATERENAALDAAAAATVRELAERGVTTAIVSQRLNRRKIDLIPEPEWSDPPKARIAQLLGAVEGRLRDAGLNGIPDAVEIAERCAHRAGLDDPRVTSDAKHVEIGLTDKSDSARWVFQRLWQNGISPRTVLVVGDEFGPLGGLPGSDSLLISPQSEGCTVVSVGREPNGVPPGVVTMGGGPSAFLAVLDDQIDRRERRDPPLPAGDVGWTLRVDGLDPELERAHEALLTIADGTIGTTGAPVWRHPAATPQVLSAGIYDGEGVMTQLLQAPLWHQVARELPADGRLRRTLDLRIGIEHHTLDHDDARAEATMFSSLARPGTVALRAQGSPALVPLGAALRTPAAVPAEEGQIKDTSYARVSAGTGGICVAMHETADTGPGRLERLGVYRCDPAQLPSAIDAASALREVEASGFERVLGEHRAAWAARWANADIDIAGDDDLQTALRFALFHLMAAVSPTGEAAVGARGLSGPGYRGHVFWDTDVFVLPFMAATHPPAARAILEYRHRRLAAARRAAADLGMRGARFAWESAGTGFDVTPHSVRDHTGRLIPIRTGEREEHIMADIAWAAACYLSWTADEEFAAGPGRELLIETARYWASRVRLDHGGRGHIYGVIGPDEYHEPVDDNAYTNVMARWNLRRAADHVSRYGGAPEEESREWREIAERLVDGYHPELGVHEEFAGFFDLEPLVIADVAPRRPIAADLLLGPERVARAQVVKQADVLMLHHLLPDEMPGGSLARDVAFYESRTAHGSSLSPAVHAAVLARVGRLGRALQSLHLAATIDLEDATGTTAGGLHLATMGGVWQAMVYGFAGVRPRGDVLVVSPHLPDQWERLHIRMQFRGVPVSVSISHGGVVVDADEPVKWKVEDS